MISTKSKYFVSVFLFLNLFLAPRRGYSQRDSISSISELIQLGIEQYDLSLDSVGWPSIVMENVGKDSLGQFQKILVNNCRKVFYYDRLNKFFIVPITCCCEHTDKICSFDVLNELGQLEFQWEFISDSQDFHFLRFFYQIHSLNYQKEFLVYNGNKSRNKDEFKWKVKGRTKLILNRPTLSLTDEDFNLLLKEILLLKKEQQNKKKKLESVQKGDYRLCSF